MLKLLYQQITRGSVPWLCHALGIDRLMLTGLNAQIEELAITGALTGDPLPIYHAIAHDPLTAAVLSLAEIKALVNEMFQQNKPYLPHFKGFSV